MMNTAWVESEYNNRQRVPDFATHIAHWVELAEAVKLPSKVLSYGETARSDYELFDCPSLSTAVTGAV
jgi:hypothetical protein